MRPDRPERLALFFHGELLASSPRAALGRTLVAALQHAGMLVEIREFWHGSEGPRAVALGDGSRTFTVHCALGDEEHAALRAQSEVRVPFGAPLLVLAEPGEEERAMRAALDVPEAGELLVLGAKDAAQFAASPRELFERLRAHGAPIGVEIPAPVAAPRDERLRIAHAPDEDEALFAALARDALGESGFELVGATGLRDGSAERRADVFVHHSAANTALLRAALRNGVPAIVAMDGDACRLLPHAGHGWPIGVRASEHGPVLDADGVRRALRDVHADPAAARARARRAQEHYARIAGAERRHAGGIQGARVRAQLGRNFELRTGALDDRATLAAASVATTGLLPFDESQREWMNASGGTPVRGHAPFASSEDGAQHQRGSASVAMSEPVHVRLLAPVFASSSYGRIARYSARCHAADPRLRIGLAPRQRPERAPELDHDLWSLLEEPWTQSEVCVCSGWPFEHARPDCAVWVQRFDWEYGALPREIAATLAHGPDEIWVHSRHVEGVLRGAGVPQAKIRVQPHGFDPDCFAPGREPLPELRERIAGRHAFAFVGAPIARKGFDALLAAWLRAFRRADPVCLVVKIDTKCASYAGQGQLDLLERVAAHPAAPELVLVDADLDDDAMGRLFASVDTLVHPYRGEGFGMPVLEARGAGLPVIVTAGGAPAEFLLETGTLSVGARHVPVQIPEACLGRPQLLDPDPDELVQALQLARTHAAALRAEALADVPHYRAHYSWPHVCAEQAERLFELGMQARAAHCLAGAAC